MVKRRRKRSTVNTTPRAPTFLVQPSISGVTAVGRELTLDLGVVDAYPAAGLTIKWFADAVEIGGATTTKYTPVSGDAGKTITAQVVAANGNLPDATGTASGVGPIGTAPAVSVAAAISGTVAVGQTLTFSATFTGSPTPTKTYRLLRAGLLISTSSSYVIVDADIGSSLTVEATGTNVYGTAVTTSAGTIQVPDPYTAPVNTVPPTLSGNTPYGSVITMGDGTFTANPAITSYIRRWYRDGVLIAGQSGATYTSLVTDINKTITGDLVAVNSRGQSVAVLTSNSIVVTSRLSITASDKTFNVSDQPVTITDYAVADLDDTGGLYKLEMPIGIGGITLDGSPTFPGITFENGDGTTDPYLIIIGTTTDLNAALTGMALAGMTTGAATLPMPFAASQAVDVVSVVKTINVNEDVPDFRFIVGAGNLLKIAGNTVVGG